MNGWVRSSNGEGSWRLSDLEYEWGEVELVDKEVLETVKRIVDNSVHYSAGFQTRMKEARMVLKEIGINAPLRIGKYRPIEKEKRND
jgi:hypothetical protein